MKLAYEGADLAYEIGGLLEIRLFGRVRIEPEIAPGVREDIVGRVQHVDAAILEFGQVLRLENDIPTVDLRAGPENALHRLDVVTDSRGSPHIVGAVLIVRI